MSHQRSLRHRAKRTSQWEAILAGCYDMKACIRPSLRHLSVRGLVRYQSAHSSINPRWWGVGATQQSFIRGGSLDIWVRYHFSLADTLACSTSLSFFLVYWPFRPLPCFYNCRHCCFGLLFDLHYMAYFLLTTSPCVCFLISSTTLLDILETKKIVKLT